MTHCPMTLHLSRYHYPTTSPPIRHHVLMVLLAYYLSLMASYLPYHLFLTSLHCSITSPITSPHDSITSLWDHLPHDITFLWPHLQHDIIFTMTTACKWHHLPHGNTCPVTLLLHGITSSWCQVIMTLLSRYINSHMTSPPHDITSPMKSSFHYITFQWLHLHKTSPLHYNTHLDITCACITSSLASPSNDITSMRWTPHDTKSLWHQHPMTSPQ